MHFHIIPVQGLNTPFYEMKFINLIFAGKLCRFIHQRKGSRCLFLCLERTGRHFRTTACPIWLRKFWDFHALGLKIPRGTVACEQ